MKASENTVNYLKSKLYHCPVCNRYVAVLRIWWGMCDDCHQKHKLETRATKLLAKSIVDNIVNKDD